MLYNRNLRLQSNKFKQFTSKHDSRVVIDKIGHNLFSFYAEPSSHKLKGALVQQVKMYIIKINDPRVVVVVDVIVVVVVVVVDPFERS